VENIERRKRNTLIIIAAVYFIAVIFLTNYSSRVFLNGLPVVETFLPIRGAMMENGRHAYLVPKNSVKIDIMTMSYYVCILEEKNDILGKNYYPRKITVIPVSTEDEYISIDGLKYVQPVILLDDPRIENGIRVRLND